MNLRDPLKALIVLYLMLLLIEGALRKWVAPGMSNLLMLIRDPVAILIYMVAAPKGHLWTSRYMGYWSLLCCGFALLGIIQIGMGLPTSVMIFGLRTYLLHWPLVFVLASCLSYNDVVWIGRWTLLLSIPMTYLMVVQFRSPALSPINATAGGGSGVQIMSALGHVRPAGTFSYSTGPTAFYPIAVAFLVYGFWRRAYSKWILLFAAFAIVGALPISGSRSMVLGCALVLLAGFAVGLTRGGIAALLASVAIPIVGAFYVLSMFEFYEEGKAAFKARWEDANAAGGGVQGSIFERTINGFVTPFRSLAEAPLLGEGIGLGTNAGSVFALGRVTFVFGETDWQRILMEAGPILGLAFIAFRAGMVIEMGIRAFGLAVRGASLAWLLFAAAGLNVIFGTTAQPTNLGFVVVGAGLCFAALKEPGMVRLTVIYPWARAAAQSQNASSAPATIAGS